MGPRHRSLYAASAKLGHFFARGVPTLDQVPTLSYWRKSCWRTDGHMPLALGGDVVVASVHPDGDENVQGLNLSTGAAVFR
jgi:hypothetical protein